MWQHQRKQDNKTGFQLFEEFAQCLEEYLESIKGEGIATLAKKLHVYKAAIASANQYGDSQQAQANIAKFNASKAFIESILFEDEDKQKKSPLTDPILLETKRTQYTLDRARTVTSSKDIVQYQDWYESTNNSQASFHSGDNESNNLSGSKPAPEYSFSRLKEFKKELHQFYWNLHQYRPIDGDPHATEIQSWIADHAIPNPSKVIFSTPEYDKKFHVERLCYAGLLSFPLYTLAVALVLFGWDAGSPVDELNYETESSQIASVVCLTVACLVAPVIISFNTRPLVKRGSFNHPQLGGSIPVLYDTFDIDRAMLGGSTGLVLGVCLALIPLLTEHLFQIQEYVNKSGMEYELPQLSEAGVASLAALGFGCMVLGALLYGYKDTIQGHVTNVYRAWKPSSTYLKVLEGEKMGNSAQT